MAARSFFAPEVVTEVVKVHPRFLGANVREHLLSQLKTRYEDRCSSKGYFSPGSIELLRVGAPLIEAFTLRGYVKFPVEFRAELFNPPEKAIIDATVKIINDFGILAVVQSDGREVMHIAVPRQIATLRSVIPEGIAVGDKVSIEIVRRKVVENESVLYGMGRIHNQGISLQDAGLQTSKGSAVAPRVDGAEDEEDVVELSTEGEDDDEVVSLDAEGTDEEEEDDEEEDDADVEVSEASESSEDETETSEAED